MSWELKKIKDLGKVITGKTPSTKNRAYYDGNYMFVTPTDLNYKHYFCRQTQRTVTDEARNSYKNQFIPKNSIMFTCIGNTIGKCAISSETCLTNQQINSIVPNKKNDYKFIYYLLIHNMNYIKKFGGGSATPIINKSTFENLEFMVPSLEIQRKIASILSAYDDLIENNLKRISLLEESVRLIYKEWFQNLRFPGYEHTKIIDGVPNGWEKVVVPEVIEINPKTFVPKDKEKWYIEMADLSENSMVISYNKKRTGSSGSKFKNGDTLFARITPCLENGKTGYVNFLSEDEVAIGSTEFIVLRPKLVPGEYVYCLARSYHFREHARKSMIGSSGRQRVQTSCFDEYTLLMPPKKLLETFKVHASVYFQQIKVLATQNQKLQEARDLLLPKLMSGEVSV